MTGSAATPLSSAALNRLKVSEMRATIWHHAKLAKGTANAAGRCVNPNLIQGKPDLFTFIATHLKNDVFDAPTAEMMVTWNREGGDHALITALLESVNPRAGGQPASDNQADDNKDERREGEQGDDGEGEEDEDDHDSREEQPLPVLVKKLKEARPVQTRGARNQATATTVVRQAETAVMTRYTLCTNPECEEMFPFTISADLPNFCPKCGTNLRGGRQQGGTQTSATAPAVTPTVWARASSFQSAPLFSLVPAAHMRQHGLAPLDDKIVKQAREGKQHYSLSDLLQSHAEDRSSASSALLNDRAVLFDTIDGTFTAAVGAAVTAARTATSRRRTITGFSEIAEVIIFSLIGNIYEGRPDIGQQMFGLLAIAQDLCRHRGWAFALDYVTEVRLRFWSSRGGPSGQHYLLINSAYDMGVRDNDVLMSMAYSKVAALPQASRNMEDNSSGNGNRTAAADNRRKASEPCRNWNNGNCHRTDCRFLHVCLNCNTAGHTTTQCSSRLPPSGSTPAATPAVNTRPTKGGG
jgi:hypothetical protein